MAKRLNGISAFDSDILRNAFKKSVRECNVPEVEWRALAATMAGDLTGRKQIEPDVLDWIIRK